MIAQAIPHAESDALGFLLSSHGVGDLASTVLGPIED